MREIWGCIVEIYGSFPHTNSAMNEEIQRAPSLDLTTKSCKMAKMYRMPYAYTHTHTNTYTLWQKSHVGWLRCLQCLTHKYTNTHTFSLWRKSLVGCQRCTECLEHTHTHTRTYSPWWKSHVGWLRCLERLTHTHAHTHTHTPSLAKESRPRKEVTHSLMSSFKTWITSLKKTANYAHDTGEAHP